LRHDLYKLGVFKATSARKILLAVLSVSTTAVPALAASVVRGVDVLPARGATLLAAHLLHVSALVFRARLHFLAVLHVSTTVAKARATAMVTGIHVLEASRTVLFAGHLLELLAHFLLFSSSASAARLVRGFSGGVLVAALPRGLAPPTGLVLGTVVTVLISPAEREVLAFGRRFRKRASPVRGVVVALFPVVIMPGEAFGSCLVAFTQFYATLRGAE